MKPRILKKLSKKALAIYAASPRRDFQADAKHAWIDDEFEPSYPRCIAKTPKAKRACEQACVSVNHIPSIGGEWDSALGEATEFTTFYEHAFDYVLMSCLDFGDCTFNIDEPWPAPTVTERLTGKRVLELLREYASEVPS